MLAVGSSHRSQFAERNFGELQENFGNAQTMVMMKIRELLQLNWDIQFSFVSREFNLVADSLAKLGFSSVVDEV